MTDMPQDMDPMTALDRLPLGADLHRALAEEIVTGRLAPGAKLVELDLCERYGVSRSPLRDALRLLERSGLVVHRPRYGVRVAPISVDNLDDITTCRLSLEATAARQVAERKDHARVAADLSVCLARMHAANDAGDHEGCFAENIALMAILHVAVPNKVLAGLLAQLDLPARRYRFLCYRHEPATLRMLLRSNAEMVEAIRAGNGRRARDITQKMVQEAWLRLRARLLEMTAGQAVPEEEP